MKLPRTLIPSILTGRISYISDVHVADPYHKAYYVQMPRIEPTSGILAVCGDVGLPTTARFREFFKQISPDFDHIYFVPGNHEYDCSSLFKQTKVDQYLPYIEDVIAGIPNVHLLNNRITKLPPLTYSNEETPVWIAGTTLWSNPILSPTKMSQKNPHIDDHIDRHKQDVKWLDHTVKLVQHLEPTSKVIVMSHFMPTFKLIGSEYEKYGKHATGWFATDLEDQFMYPKSPICGWMAGHSHSNVRCMINNVDCGSNAKHWN